MNSKSGRALVHRSLLYFWLLLPLALCAHPWTPASVAGTRIVARGIPDTVSVASVARAGTSDLAEIVRDAPDSSTVIVEGHHWLRPQAYVDSTCGNCEEPATLVNATVGLVLKGVAKRVVGVSPDRSVIHTRAGYGILFEDCISCSVESLTIADGERDPDGNATNAAVVVKESSVRVAHNRIANNIGDSSVVRQVVVGIMGVTGREGSEIVIEKNAIVRNSWDGVALYRDANAVILDNVIDGVDLARGEAVGGGRGVGIGITWNANATVARNLVRKYWKGIGVFVDASATVENNVVEDVATWGISLWDAGRGHARAEVRENVVFRTGACGVAIISGDEEQPDDEADTGQTRGDAGTSGVGTAGAQAGVDNGERAEGSVPQEEDEVPDAKSNVSVSVLVRSADVPAVEARGDTAGPSSLLSNALVLTGQDPRYDSGEPYCYQVALALHKKPLGFVENGNLFFSNREPGDKPGSRDIEKQAFLARISQLEQTLRASGPTARSEFLKWLDAERVR